MTDDAREAVWETLFDRAVELMNSVRAHRVPVDDWTFGGGTVLMRRHRHRLSKDIDIFIGDPQFIGFLSPRLNALAEKITDGNYSEDGSSVKLILAEGEIDFIAAGTQTTNPASLETVRSYRILVEKSAEIIAKKVWFRGAEFTARDIFDLSMVIELEPASVAEIEPILRLRRDDILGRIERHHDHLRESFDALTVLEYQRSFEDCVQILREALSKVG
ncbi:MAG: nucleotidyl transferase AbiEii/AbiGii toxin family protein [Pyrinomonadaceae bacterium]